MTKTIKSKTYDLEERTAIFAEEVIKLCKTLPKNVITIPIIGQLVRASTSVGANYCEANGASSKRDFRNKIFICKKESKESRYWLRILKTSIEKEAVSRSCDNLSQEAQELVLIFSKIASSSK